MTNQYGLDVNYFKGKLKILLRDLDNYTPTEFNQELSNMKEAVGVEALEAKSKSCEIHKQLSILKQAELGRGKCTKRSCEFHDMLMEDNCAVDYQEGSFIPYCAKYTGMRQNN